MLLRINPAFWILNVFLLVLTAAAIQYHPLSILGVIVVTVASTVWFVGGVLNRQRFHAIVGSEWIEGEVGIYSAFGFWGGILIVAAATDQAQVMPLFGIVEALVILGAVGMIASQLPLTRMFGRGS